jgi:hypothetical protein
MSTTRRSKRGGQRNRRSEPEQSFAPTPTGPTERRLPEGVRPSHFPGGGFVSDCARCRTGWWRATVEQLTTVATEHAGRYHREA